MSLMKWSDEYLLKIPELDKEHKLLSEMINCLHESMLTDRDSKVVNKNAEKLVSYAETHFKNEEKLMYRDDFSDADSHKLSHGKLLRKLKELIKDICPVNKRDIARTALLDDWLMDHLLIEDKKYGFYVENEERYRLIMDGVNIIGWEYDPFKDRFTFVSRKAEKITGYTPQQWYEKGFWASHIHPEDRDFALQYCKSATERGEDHEFEYRMVKADGSIVWLKDIVQVISENGETVGLRGIFIDVTEKKKMEKEIDTATKVVQLLPEIAVATSESSTFEEAMHICIDKVCLHTGWDVGHVYLPDSEGSLFPTKLWYIKNLQQFDTFRKVTEVTPFDPGVGLPGRVLAHGKPAWITDVTKDPNFPRAKLAKDINVRFGFAFPVMLDKKTVAVLEFFAEKSLRPDKYFLEAISSLSAHLARVYERKKSEELLKSSYDYLQKLNDSLGDVILTVKIPERIIEYVNRAVESVFGYKPDECVGKKTKMLYPEVEEYHDFGRLLKNAIKEEKKELRVEKLLKRKNGEMFSCEITTTFLKENGRIARCISLIHDITERKEAEGIQQKHNKVLEQKNIALTEVLNHVQLEKRQVKEDVIANVENLLLPVIQKIRLKGESLKYVKLLKKNLKELTSSFGSKLTKKETKLTPRELEICNMVKNGLASKEIADLLNLSLRTLETHRTHIRKKLGLTQKEVNLASFLKSL